MCGASSEAENWSLVRGLTCGASIEAENRYLIRGLMGGASGEAENRYLVRGFTFGASGEAENRYPVRGLTVLFWDETVSGEPRFCSRWAGRSNQASDEVGVLPVVVS